MAGLQESLAVASRAEEELRGAKTALERELQAVQANLAGKEEDLDGKQAEFEALSARMDGLSEEMEQMVVELQTCHARQVESLAEVGAALRNEIAEQKGQLVAQDEELASKHVALLRLQEELEAVRAEAARGAVRVCSEDEDEDAYGPLLDELAKAVRNLDVQLKRTAFVLTSRRKEEEDKAPDGRSANGGTQASEAEELKHRQSAQDGPSEVSGQETDGEWQGPQVGSGADCKVVGSVEQCANVVMVNMWMQFQEDEIDASMAALSEEIEVLDAQLWAAVIMVHELKELHDIGLCAKEDREKEVEQLTKEVARLKLQEEERERQRERELEALMQQAVEEYRAKDRVKDGEEGGEEEEEEQEEQEQEPEQSGGKGTRSHISTDLLHHSHMTLSEIDERAVGEREHGRMGEQELGLETVKLEQSLRQIEGERDEMAQSLRKSQVRMQHACVG